MNPLICSACQTILTPDVNFCPKCGVKIKDVILSPSVAKQLGIYALSVFLPPLGLWPGIKYLRQKEQKAKIVGILAILLTIISSIASIWFSVALFDQFSSKYTTQLNQYQNIGL